MIQALREKIKEALCVLTHSLGDLDGHDYSVIESALEAAQKEAEADMKKCDCGRGHQGIHNVACEEFPPGAPTPKERIVIARARVERRKAELDQAQTEYVLACQTLAIAIERQERSSEIATEPENAKPSLPC